MFVLTVSTFEFVLYFGVRVLYAYEKELVPEGPFQKPLQAPASGSSQQSQIAVVRLRMKLRFINACLTHLRFSPAIHGLRNFWKGPSGTNSHTLQYAVQKKKILWRTAR